MNNGQSSLITFSMVNNYVWLTSSFFYDIKKWYIVLSEIENFLLNYIKNEFIYFYISLTYSPVNTVQFAILCRDEQTMDNIGAKFYDYFTKFKESNRPKKYIVEVKGIGMPYPSDTFQIGLFHIHYNQKEIFIYKFQENFSKLIFRGLTKTFIEEDAHVLNVYAVLTLVKSMFDSNHLLANAVFEDLQKDYFNDSSILKDSFPDEFNEIKSLANQLLSNEDIEKEEPWLAEWFGLCKIEVEKCLAYQSDSVLRQIKLRDFYIDKTTVIARQLGVDKETNRTLICLINCALVF